MTVRNNNSNRWIAREESLGWGVIWGSLNVRGQLEANAKPKTRGRFRNNACQAN